MRNHIHKPSPAKALETAPSNAVLQLNTMCTTSHCANGNVLTSPSVHKTGFEDDLGPMVDDGAAYSEIGVLELSLVGPLMMQSLSKTCDPIPAKLSQYKW